MLDWLVFTVANDIYDLEEHIEDVQEMKIEDVAYVIGGIVEIMKEHAQDNNTIYNLNGILDDE